MNTYKFKVSSHVKFLDGLDRAAARIVRVQIMLKNSMTRIYFPYSIFYSTKIQVSLMITLLEENRRLSRDFSPPGIFNVYAFLLHAEVVSLCCWQSVLHCPTAGVYQSALLQLLLLLRFYRVDTARTPSSRSPQARPRQLLRSQKRAGIVNKIFLLSRSNDLLLCS